VPNADDRIASLVDAVGGAMAMLPLLAVAVVHVAPASGGSSISTSPVIWLVLCAILRKIVRQMDEACCW
jgi:hypothetical protein